MGTTPPRQPQPLWKGSCEYSRSSGDGPEASTPRAQLPTADAHPQTRPARGQLLRGCTVCAPGLRPAPHSDGPLASCSAVTVLNFPSLLNKGLCVSVSCQARQMTRLVQLGGLLPRKGPLILHVQILVSRLHSGELRQGQQKTPCAFSCSPPQ